MINRALAAARPQLDAARRHGVDDARAIASEQANLARAVDELPAALRQATTTLNKVQPFAELLGPTARRAAPGGRRR